MSVARGRGSRTAQRRALDFIARASQSVPPTNLGSPPGSSQGGSTSSRTPGGSGTDTDYIVIKEVSENLFPIDPSVNPTKIAHVITQSFKMYVDREGVAWRFVSDSSRDTYWAEFKKVFRWEMPFTDGRVYELWLARAKVRYRDCVNLVKSKRPTTGRTKYMDEDTWVQWCNYWDNTEVKEKSAQAKQNRLSEADGPGTGYGRHIGGSRSVDAYSYEMRIPMAQTVVPTFRKLH